MPLNFADDSDVRALEERETARISLTINATKAMYIVAGKDKDRPSGVDAEVVFDWNVLEVVQESVYLETRSPKAG